MDDKVNILLVDDQASKLLSYEVILQDLGQNLITAMSAQEALGQLLRQEIAVILIDVCMPDLDGFELATMIRDHPRFQQTSIIFVSAIHLSDIDRLRGYEAGAVDYVPVPVVPEVLRAKVRIFVDLFRKTRALEKLNAELESRVSERTAELAAAAARLQESEERRTLALASGQMGSWDWDVRSGAITWDEGQCRICGIESDAAPRTMARAFRFLHRADLRRVKQVRAQACDSRTFQFELRLIRADGEVRWCTCAGAIVRDAEGNVCRITGVTTDITQRKLAEDALQKLNDDLERRIEDRTREREHALAQLFEAQKLDTIGRLTGGVAHDFNNLLMAVLGSLQLLRKRVQGDERALRLVDNATLGAERGAALTQRLLAFARRQELRPESVAIQTVVRNMEDLLHRAVGSMISIELDIPDDLSPVMIDSNQLELALLNLAINARDAMPDGGVLRISASVQPACSSLPGDRNAGSFVRLCVADTGAGMDAATLARATEPFFTTKGPGKGTGLGLSMVHGLAAQSGGTMKLDSEIGKGTRVELWLPPALGAPAPRVDAVHEPLESDSGAPKRVLVVDDDPLVAAGTSAMLEELGHSVVEVHSAADAMHMLGAQSPFDVMVTDHMMPGMTGAQLAEIAREKYPRLGIILASGYAELPNVDQRRAFAPRLAKPFSLQELAAAISRVATDAAIPRSRSA